MQVVVALARRLLVMQHSHEGLPWATSEPLHKPFCRPRCDRGFRKKDNHALTMIQSTLYGLQINFDSIVGLVVI